MWATRPASRTARHSSGVSSIMFPPRLGAPSMPHRGRARRRGNAPAALPCGPLKRFRESSFHGRNQVGLRVRRGRRRREAGRRGLGRGARPPRGQGGQPRRHDPAGGAGAPRLHRHHRGLPGLPGRRRGLPAGLLGPDREGPRAGGEGHGQALRRSRRAAAGLLPLRGQVLHARDDGHRPEHRPQRRGGRRPGPPHRGRALRVRLLPPPRPDVRRRRARASPTRPSRRSWRTIAARPGWPPTPSCRRSA